MYNPLEDEFEMFCSDWADREGINKVDISEVKIILKMFSEAYIFSIIKDKVLKKRIERFRHVYALIIHEDFISEFCSYLKMANVDNLENLVAFVSDGDYYDGFIEAVLNDGLFEIARIVTNNTDIYARPLRYEAFGMRLRIKLLMEFNRVVRV